MISSINIKKIWEDDDMIEVTVTISDGSSVFATNVYVGNVTLEETLSELNRFKTHVHGGLYDLTWGAFGPEYASGAVSIRLHFYHQARLCISCKSESEYFDFGKKHIAQSAEQYFYSEPALLDRFIEELGSIASGSGFEATLECKN